MGRVLFFTCRQIAWLENFSPASGLVACAEYPLFTYTQVACVLKEYSLFTYRQVACMQNFSPTCGLVACAEYFLITRRQIA